MPVETFHAFAEHGEVKDFLPADGGDAEEVLAEFARAGVNDAPLAAQLEREGADAFEKAWSDLIACIAAKREALKNVAQK